MLGGPQLPGHRIVNGGKSAVRSGPGPLGDDEVHELAVQRPGGAPQRFNADRPPFLGSLQLRIGLPRHRGLVGGLVLRHANRLAHGPEPATRRHCRGIPGGVQGLEPLLEANEDDCSNLPVYAVFRLSKL